MDYNTIIGRNNYKDVIASAFKEKEGTKNFNIGKKKGITYIMACCVANAALQEHGSMTLCELANIVEAFPNAIELHKYIVDHGADNYYWNKVLKEHRQAEFEVARVEVCVFLKPTEQVLEEIKELENANA